IVRLAGIGLLVFGFALILGPLGVIADVIPFVGWIVRMGTGIVALIAGVLVGTATIALAWFFYRPFTALVVLAIGVAVSFVIPRLVKRRGASVPQLGDDAAQAYGTNASRPYTTRPAHHP